MQGLLANSSLSSRRHHLRRETILGKTVDDGVDLTKTSPASVDIKAIILDSTIDHTMVG